MKAPLKVGLDLDGVFADFNGDRGRHGMIRTLIDVTGRDLFPATGKYEPDSFNWFHRVGYKASEVEATWHHIIESTTWWYLLSPEIGASAALYALNQMQHGQGEERANFYFLTTRPGVCSHTQSRLWLTDNRMRNPQVLVARNSEAKGQLVQALGLDVIVDDYVENLKMARKYSETVKLVLFDQLWNMAPDVRLPVLELGAESVPNLGALVKKIEAWALEVE